MSNTTWVASLAYTLMPPAAPADAITALDLIRPSSELRLELCGRLCPAGQTVTNPSGPGGTTARFSEYACAVDGIPHEPAGMVNVRAAPPERMGPPKADVALRVSTTRHGVTGMKRSATGGELTSIESLDRAEGEPPPETLAIFSTGDETTE